ncbi:MAG: cytochrome P450 [Parasphingorhabdus sp.]
MDRTGQFNIEQSDIFRNGTARSTVLLPSMAIEQIKAFTGGRPSLIRTMLEVDSPEHMPYRKITQLAFMPAKLKPLQERIAIISDEFADKLASHGGECDFVKEVALLFPLRVIMELVGIPKEDEPLMLRLTQELFASADSDLNANAADIDAETLAAHFNQVIAEFGAYFTKLIEDRRSNPREDMASVISNAKIDGELLAPMEIMSYFVVIATAGHDTTSHTISSTMWQLAQNSELLERIKADMSLVDGLIEESLRWEAPVRTFMRNATRDVEFAGKQVKEGDWLMLCYLSGNRDEAVFEDPFNLPRWRCAICGTPLFLGSRQWSWRVNPRAPPEILCPGPNLCRSVM